MKGKVLLSGGSVLLKLLKESLIERGLEVLEKNPEDLEKFVKDYPPDVIILEIQEPTKADLPRIFSLLKSFSSNVVILAEKVTVETAVELIKAGAYDLKLLSSPLEVIEKAVLLALGDKRLILEEGRFLTQDRRLMNILAKLEEVSKTEVPILLVGESGTGKELLARYIHTQSNRRYGPFVAINCAALPETLLESELFGYEKGAFSGANFRKKGKIELAHGGTLLLDEITETSPLFQSKLLRVIQEREIDRLGGYHPIKVDFRLISTTNRDIEKVVAEGKFREDLYFRINVITIKIPPLRERKTDVKLLTEYYLEKFSHLYRKDIRGLTEKAWEFLLNYDFPGNVRELRNLVERGVLSCQGTIIELPHLTNPFSEEETPLEEGKPQNLGTIFELKNKGEQIKPLEDLEREAILRALRMTQGNKAKAAELLGITVRTIRNKLKQYEELGLLKGEEWRDVG